jgi:hypothetical protein
MAMTDGELRANRHAQDHVMAERHAGFNLAAQDKRMKYERASFVVGGEGGKSAPLAYRTNYSLIDWEESDGVADDPEVLSSSPAGDESAVGH